MTKFLQILTLVLTLMTAVLAKADTAWIQCEVRLAESNELIGQARSTDDYACKDNCNLIYWDNELRLGVNGIFQAPNSLLIKAKDYTNNIKAENTVEIKTELNKCDGHMINTGEYKINCEYCQQD